MHEWKHSSCFDMLPLLVAVSFACPFLFQSAIHALESAGSSIAGAVSGVHGADLAGKEVNVYRLEGADPVW